MSRAESQRLLTKTERQSRIHRFLHIQDFFRYLFAFVSFTGWVGSVGLYLLYLTARALYSDIEYILFVVFIIMLSGSRGDLRYYFRRLPWYAMIIPAAILLYGIWHLSMGFGSLDEMPPDLRVVAKYHQTMFMHSFIVSGYTFFCFLWSYIIRKQSPRKKRA